MVTVSSPGKIYLMGEHAVVYGRPALLSAVGLRMRVSVEKRNEVKGLPVQIISTEPTELAQYAVDYVFSKLAVESPEAITVTIDSDIPAGFHLGSSAALAVSITGALMYFYKKIWNPIRINELAYEIEKKQHGTPSGADNTAVTMGGFIWYRRELEFLRSIWQLPFRPHQNLGYFLLINTGRPTETTGEMVTQVKKFYDSHTDEVNALFHKNEQQVRNITVALKEGIEKDLIDSIKAGEQTLEALGVVGKRVIPLIRSIEKFGGAAKILGGGGVMGSTGFLLCYHRDKKKIEELCSLYQWSVLDIALGEEGVRLDEK